MFDKSLLAGVTVLLVGFGTLAAADEFRVGAQAGIPDWSMDVEVSLLAVSASADPGVSPSAGLVAQYVTKTDEEVGNGFYVGVEAGFTSGSDAGTEELTLLGAQVEVETEISWVADVLWLAGFDLGEVSAFGGQLGDVSVFGLLGGSYAGGEVGVAIPSLDASGSDDAKHFGWKFGAGAEFDVSESVALQVRATYTLFEESTYRDQGVSIGIEPGAFEVRASLLYRFDAGDLFGRR